jgi:assimilatory nitrate reductase catalytic subunit
MYSTTETAQLAHLVLPAAGWGEKEGTFINSERRIGVVKKVKRAPGQALSDFSIFRLIAEGWGCGEMFREWSSPAAAFQILKQLSRGQPCDITGIRDYEHLDECGGIQWPFPEGATKPATERRLFEDGRFFHADGKARFYFEEPRPLPEPTNTQFPFLLLTGRGTASQWHTQTRTAKSAVLRKLCPQSLHVEINPQDARELGVRPHDRVVVESRRGILQARAVVTPTIPAGQLFLPMHDSATNRLTDAMFDPYSKQPAYKSCAVRIRVLAK